MAQIPVRLNTQQMIFPLLSRLAGETIISAQGDLTYVPGVSTDGGVPEDRGIPSVFYAHNVMPSTYGWQSIGYEEQAPSAGSGFRNIYLVYGATVPEPEEPEDEDDEPEEPRPVASQTRTYIAKVVSGSDASLYVLRRGDREWQEISNSPTFSSSRQVTTAHINGFTYIMVARTGFYVLNTSNNQLIERDLEGLNISALDGIVTTSGYLLTYTTRRVTWSSTINPEDHVPSDVSGAGGGGVQEARGNIISGKATNLGLILYTDTNAVSVIYTGNENFPFEFRDIPSVGGIYDQKLVSEESADGYHYAYTTNGIQRISHNQSSSLFPFITDFIEGNIFEDYTEEEGLVERSVTSQMNRALAMVANRYMIISYAREDAGEYSHAIVYDLAQHRIGKLRHPHREIFEFRSVFAGTSQDSRSAIALLSDNGEINTVSFDLDAADNSGVLIMGRISLIRERQTFLHMIEAQNLGQAEFGLLTHTAEGVEVPGYHYLEQSSDQEQVFLFDSVSKYHNLTFLGTFNILSLVIHVGVHGK